MFPLNFYGLMLKSITIICLDLLTLSKYVLHFVGFSLIQVVLLIKKPIFYGILYSKLVGLEYSELQFVICLYDVFSLFLYDR